MAKTIVLYETLQPTGKVIAHRRRAIEESGMHVLEEPEIELVPNPSYVGGISDAPSDVYRLTFQVEAVDRQPQASTSTKVTGWGWAFFILLLILILLVVVADLIVNNTGDPTF
ncbi:MAG TPA: hypothetical protein VGL16_10600 [Actinomycetota bacterium]|jgi:hypothetical protein